jgi:hypothetical protein
MDSLDIGKGIRKSWGGVKPVERVHRDERVRKSEKDHRRELRQGLEVLDDPDGEDADNDTDFPVRLNGGRKHAEMMALRNEKGESVIPEGDCCYGSKGNCPYWDRIPGKPEQGDGYCWFLEHGDWMDDGKGMTNIFDQIKCCGINDNLINEMLDPPHEDH